VIHALRELPEQYDYVVLLQPTSPLRSAEDIDACIDICNCPNVPSCVSLVEPDKHPYWMYSLDAEHKLSPLFPAMSSSSRRQELPPLYSLNGAVYVAKVDWLLMSETFIDRETAGYVMPRERSIDVDSEADLLMAEWMLRKLHPAR
jgi:N-acylneuraminate cytidylyltransferase